MAVIHYLFLVLLVCLLAMLSYGQSASRPDSDRTVSRATPWIRILVIAFLLSFYSMNIGLSGQMVDRVNYAYSFYHRYPVYFDSLERLMGARTEPGIIILSNIVSSFTEDFEWLFFFTTFLATLINLYVISKISSSFLQGAALFLVSLCFFQGTYLIKQSMAIAFANLAFLSLIKGKRLRYVIYAAVACLFHSTAVILLPLYFVLRLTKTVKAYIFTVFIFLLVYISFIPLIYGLLPRLPFIGQYIALEDARAALETNSLGSLIKGLPYYIITFFALMYRKELKKRLAYADTMIVASVVYSMSWLLTFRLYWSFRLGWYLMLPTLLLVPELFKCLPKTGEGVLIKLLSVMLLLIFTARQIMLIL